MALVRNCFYENTEHPWEHWRLNPNDAVSFEVIGANISALGCGYLHCMQPPACAVIKEVHDRYTSFVKKLHPLDLAAGCPDAVRTYYVTLATLHERCVQLPTKVYALNYEPAQNHAWNMVLTSMTGECVGEIMEPASGEPVNPRKFLPQPFYCVAQDDNLYTFQEFRDYYGEETFHRMWSRAAACYDHNIEVVDEDGVRIERWYFHLWTVPVRQEQVRSPGKTSRNGSSLALENEKVCPIKTVYTRQICQKRECFISVG